MLFETFRRSPTILVAATVLGATACGSSSSTEPSATAACEAEPIDRFKELVIVDPAVIETARASNVSAGVWSFRHAVESLAPAGTSTSDFVHAWLENWVQTTTINGYPLDQRGESRVTGMNDRILCPWLKRTASNACDATCETCTGTELDLTLAPFKLIAIVNRMDLREQVAGEAAGEGRLVFAAVDGSGDDPAAPVLPMTLNFEYVLGESRTPAAWAKAWHALGASPAFDETYRSALEGITTGFTERGSRPASPNGSSLGQVRTNESALDWIWQLREFAIDTDGALRLRALRNTPTATFNNTTALRDYVIANAEGIAAQRFEMPLSFRGGSADQLMYSWALPGVEEPLRKAFAANTCNGCHSAENPSIDTVFHISPFRRGLGRVSAFLNDPNGKPDELTARTASLRSALCAQ